MRTERPSPPRRWIAGGVIAVVVGGGVAGAHLAAREAPLATLVARAQGATYLGSAADAPRAAGVAGGATFRPVRQRTGNDCGPAALAHCLRRLGVPAPYPDPASGIRLRPAGCGFPELVAESARSGHPATVRTSDRRDVGSLRSPAIVHMKRDHFVVFEGIDAAGRVLVHDPGLGALAYRPGAFRRAWTGHVLEFEGVSR